MSALVVSRDNLQQLAPRDREAAVTEYLTTARDRLALALEATGPEVVAAIKAEIATAADATRHLNLSKEIQTDAEEMVRRAEFALGKAIRRGQADGTVAGLGYAGTSQPDYERNGVIVSGHSRGGGEKVSTTSDFFGNSKERQAAYAMADGATDEQFNDAINEARAEGNVSRDNVVRKIKGEGSGHMTRDQRADVIADLAAQGYSSRQMPSKVGVTEEVVRRIARDFDIDIPADKIVGRTRRSNHTEMVDKTVTDLENNAEFITQFIDLKQVDMSGADEWISSLTASIRVLNRFVNDLKKETHV